jgi:hypothetical protein
MNRGPAEMRAMRAAALAAARRPAASTQAAVGRRGLIGTAISAPGARSRARCYSSSGGSGGTGGTGGSWHAGRTVDAWSAGATVKLVKGGLLGRRLVSRASLALTSGAGCGCGLALAQGSTVRCDAAPVVVVPSLAGSGGKSADEHPPAATDAAEAVASSSSSSSSSASSSDSSTAAPPPAAPRFSLWRELRVLVWENIVWIVVGTSCLVLATIFQVRNAPIPLIFPKKTTIYQDRLGSKVRKTQTNFTPHRRETSGG